ncbi:YtxH domain-containing protein [Paenibacillus sp. D51F]
MAKKKFGFAWGAIAGGIVGSVTALLLAPKSGRELRSDIGEYAVKAADTAVEIGEIIGDKAAAAARQTAAGATALKEKAIQTVDTLASGIKFWDREEDRELAVIELAAAADDSDVSDFVIDERLDAIDSEADGSGKI